MPASSGIQFPGVKRITIQAKMASRTEIAGKHSLCCVPLDWSIKGPKSRLRTGKWMLTSGTLFQPQVCILQYKKRKGGLFTECLVINYLFFYCLPAIIEPNSMVIDM